MWSPSRNLCRPAGRGERAALAGARHCAGQLDEQALVQLARAALHALAHLARPAARLERQAFSHQRRSCWRTFSPQTSQGCLLAFSSLYRSTCWGSQSAEHHFKGKCMRTTGANAPTRLGAHQGTCRRDIYIAHHAAAYRHVQGGPGRGSARQAHIQGQLTVQQR